MTTVFFFSPPSGRARVAQLVDANWLSGAGDAGADLVIGLIWRTDWISSDCIVKLAVHRANVAVLGLGVVAGVVGDAAAAGICGAQVDAVLVGHDVRVETTVGLGDLLTGVDTTFVGGEAMLVAVLADVWSDG